MLHMFNSKQLKLEFHLFSSPFAFAFRYCEATHAANRGCLALEAKQKIFKRTMVPNWSSNVFCEAPKRARKIGYTFSRFRTMRLLFWVAKSHYLCLREVACKTLTGIPSCKASIRVLFAKGSLKQASVRS